MLKHLPKNIVMWWFGAGQQLHGLKEQMKSYSEFEGFYQEYELLVPANYISIKRICTLMIYFYSIPWHCFVQMQNYNLHVMNHFSET